MTDRSLSEPISRRSIAGLAAAAGVGVPLLAACGDDGGVGTDTTGATNGGESTASAPSDNGSATGNGGGGGLATTSEIEVGGGTIFGAQNVVITQPSEGEFRGFSATCTHQGCQVGSVSDGTINCPCHNSTFSIEDGSVQGGPATQPLEQVAVTVEGDQIVLG